ncbi:MAG TPA: disulfide bond formation protein B, partial [Candidatus Paceibacterota bacterium]
TTLTLISNIGFVLFLLSFTFDKRVRRFVFWFVNKFPLHIILGVSLSGLVFSLLYSNITNFPPCELCWIQRIFLYPQVLLSLMALLRKDLSMVSYLFPLTIMGTLVSFYHSLVQWGFGTGLLACTAVGGECAKVYVLEYGYITIPFMALSSFVYLLTVSLIYFWSKKQII